ncbi:MAG: hypothetical protein NTV55_01090 [Planctomycetota bacterium]|nr:hypothetical protein [Planctomycetota bacterium]RLS41039.1 MAG: hypothetical protein DWH82_01415 [Planctomycetota bacterium]
MSAILQRMQTASRAAHSYFTPSIAVLWAGMSQGKDYSTMIANGGPCDMRMALMLYQTPEELAAPLLTGSGLRRRTDQVLEGFDDKRERIPAVLVDAALRPRLV